MAAYVRAELFFGGSRAREGLRVIDSAAGKIPADRSVTSLALSTGPCRCEQPSSLPEPACQTRQRSA
jgi:hypothetical protein